MNKLQRLSLIFVVVSVLAVPVAEAQSPQADKEMVSLLIQQEYNSGTINVINTLFSENFIRHPMETNRAELEDSIAALRTAIPDLQTTAEIMVAQDDWVAVRMRLRGTFTNAFSGQDQLSVAPTGRPVEFVANVVYRFGADGRIVEQWDGFDNLDFLAQMGVISSSPVTERPERPLYPDVVDTGMSAQNRFVLRSFMASFNQGDFATIETLFKTDFTAHNPFGKLDRTGYINDLRSLRGALPDVTMIPTQLIAEGNWTVALYRLHGTFSGNYTMTDGSSIPPTGKVLDLPIITMFRFDQIGLIAESFEEYDGLDFLTQLGLINLQISTSP